jgi:hypothetical protein
MEAPEKFHFAGNLKDESVVNNRKRIPGKFKHRNRQTGTDIAKHAGKEKKALCS